MERRSIGPLMSIGVMLTVLTAFTGMAAVPQGVSPGAIDRFSVVEVTCPAFSWQEGDGADLYELLVYALPEDFDLETNVGMDLATANPVLHTWLPEGASSWTPPMEQALIRGGRYAWFVRVVSIGTDDEVDETGDWSEARLFSISDAPSVQEVESALSVLQHYLASAEHGVDGERVLMIHRSDRSITPSNRQGNELPTTPSVLKSVLSGTAAVKGEIPDPSGETYGVVGVSSSPGGAGIGAVNTGGGPDLVLDGSTGGVADAELRESGIDRAGPSAQTFDVTNSGAGSMTLRVDGINVVTTATDHDTLGGMACGNGQLARWNGSAWVCSPDADTLAALACAADQVTKWNGAAWVCAEDEDTVYQIGPGLVLNGSQIVIDPTMFYTSFSTLDGPDSVGRYSSVAVGTDGRGLISYWDETNNDLKVAHCNDVECTGATITTLDSDGNVGRYSSVAIGTDGLGLISYYDDSNQDLKVAHCNNTLCTSATITTLDSTGAAGLDTSLAIGSDGLALIVYRVSGTLKVAHCDNLLCTSANLSSLESGTSPSVGFGTDSLALISYKGGSDDLKVAHCSNLVCSSFVLTTLDATGSVGWSSSLVIGADGLGFIGYRDETNHALKTAHCSNVECTSAYVKLHTPEPGLWEGIGPSVGIGPEGMPLVAHCDSPAYAVKVTKCNYAHCGDATTTTIYLRDGESFSGTSMAIGADGLPLIAMFDWFGDDLWVAHLPYGF